MKKTLLRVLVLTLLVALTLVPCAVSASGYSLSSTVENAKTYYVAKDSFTVDVKINDPAGIAFMNLAVDGYDDAFTMSAALPTTGVVFDSLSALGNLILTKSDYTAATSCSNPILVKLTFTVKDAAANGSYTITVGPADADACLDEGYASLSVSSTSFNIQVGQQAHVCSASTLTHHAAQAASCKATGTKEYWSCSCGKLYSDSAAKNLVADKSSLTVAKSAHTLTATAAKPATCKEDGNNAYWTCSVCGKVFSDATGKTETTVAKQVISKSTASHTWGDWQVTTPATCKDTGLKTRECSCCKKTEEEVIPVLTTHDLEARPAEEANCVSGGHVACNVCKVCGKCFDNTGREIETETEALGHVYAVTSCTWNADKKCFDYVLTCTQCTDLTGHKYEGSSAELKPATVAASCAKDGSETYTFTLTAPAGSKLAAGAQTVYTQVNILKSTGHVYTVNKWTWGTDNATCTAELICSCGHKEVVECTVTSKVTKDPGCTEKGEQTVTAVTPDLSALAGIEAGSYKNGTGYEKKIVSDVAATGHSKEMIYTEAKAATCLEAGNKEYYTCPDCKNKFADEEATTPAGDVVIKALGHDFTVEVEGSRVNATETTDGKVTYKCSHEGCEETIEVVLHATALIHHDRVSATTTSAGNIEYWECPACHKYFSDKDGKNEISEDDVVIAKIKEEEKKAPNTEDDNGLILWACVLTASAVTVGAVLTLKKNEL